MDSWSVFLANDSFTENRRSMPGFQQGLETSNDGFITKVASSSSYLEENQSSKDYHKRHRVCEAHSKTRAASNLCQVYGCNMDLSFSKDYHKRHRVCEAHSKTSVVIVSGVEQRFCQQCSRFHFLSEFDDGKRSCRRRLAGHNERRRKPSFYFLPGKRHKLLPQESFPGSFLYRVMDEHHDHRAASSRLVSFRDEPGQNRIYESKPEASGGVSYIWDLQEAVPRSTCALSLLSAQSQQHFSETNNKSFSITHPNHNQMQPLRIDPGKKTKSGSSSCNGKGSSSTVDLLQLSSHLQRIQQQQRTFTDEVKQEYINEFYCP